MNIETVLHLVVGAAMLSTIFWGVIGALRTRVAVLEATLAAHLRDEDGMEKKISHIDKTLSQVALDLRGLVGELKGRGAIAGEPE